MDHDAQQLRVTVAGLLDLPPESIDERQNLIELGMDSISMMRLAGTWRRAGVRVAFAQLVAEPTIAAWRELLASPTPEEPTEHARLDESQPFGLALMQHAYWIGRAQGQRLGGVAAHFYHEFDGRNVDPERLETAVRAVITRHGMLRVQILDDGTQRIPREDHWPGLRVHDFRDVPDAEARLADLRARLSHRVLDIAAGEVFDVQLSLAPDGTRVHVNLDMVAADALSLRILLADLACFYTDQQAPKPLDYSYPRYLADRELARKSAGRAWALDADREYWRNRLPDLPGAPQLPAASHETSATKVIRRHRQLDAEQVRVFEGICRRHGVTPAMALAAVFAETLTAWSGEPRFLLNLPLFDREPVHPDTSMLVGDFTSSVLLEWDGATPGSFAERAVRLQRQFHADAAHSGYSGVEVLRDLSKLHGEQVLAPVVYTSALGLGELFPAEVRECFGDASWIISQGPQVWLDAQVTELNGGLLVNWDAREDAFAPGVLDAMFAGYLTLLENLLSDVDAWERPVPAMLPPAQRQIRNQVNDTAGAQSGYRLHDRFFAHAAANPSAPALLWSETVSYGELAEQALRIGGHLQAQGIGRGDLVAICLPKGPDQIIAVLGVLACGAAYLPVAADQPIIRRERILRAAGVRAVIDDVNINADPLAAPVQGDETDLAYVLYTSGSTGEPKGVELTHAAAMNTVDDLNDRFGITAADRTLALSALEFDLSVYDMFAPLSVGGAVVCVSERRDATVWVDLLRTHQATVLNCVPALLDMVLSAANGRELPLRTVLLGGDWVTVDLPGRLAEVAPDCRFAGLGGTTETAIHSTVCEVHDVPPQWTSIPYGTPLRNVRLRVVDSLGRDCPDWVPGELWIGGAGVARGYRGDPAKTAEKFVDGWYRTGDQARYWPDGTVEFLGRADFQVKVRGVRIELGEIEAALTAHPDVTQAIAIVSDTGVAAAVVPAVAPSEPHWHLLGLAPGIAARLSMPVDRLLNSDIDVVLTVLADAIAEEARLLGRPVRVGQIESGSIADRLPADSMVFATVQPTDEHCFDVVVAFHATQSHAKLATKLLAPGATVSEVDKPSLDPVRLRDFAAQRLTSAMVPDPIVVLPQLPLTPNGKIDRTALRELTQASETGPVTPPRGEVERRVAEIWADIMQVTSVGREHNFFALGGDSVLATRLVSRLRAAGLDGVALAELFSSPVLADFAAKLRLADAVVENTVTAAPEARYEPFPPTDVQRAYWLGRGDGFTLGGIGCHFYREYDVPEVDLGQLEEAVNRLIQRHEMLRAVFDEAGDQRILREVPRFTIPLCEIDPMELRRTASHRVFDPTRWPLFSIEAVRLDDRTRLAIGIDNLVLDALSILIFYAELNALYFDLDAQLPPVGLSFRDYVFGALPKPEAVAAAQEHWTSRLDELPPAPKLPLAIDPAEVREPRFTRHEGRIDAERWQVITDRARDHGITPSTVLMAAFAEVLARWSTRTDLTLTVTLFDRREVHPDVNNVLGDFTSLMLVGYRREPGEDWLTAARRLQEELWQALDRREVSAVWVLRELAKRAGDPELSMPVVFTSALGVPGGTAASATGPFADQVWGLSQTPQVWLDHQVTEVAGGVSVNWDVVEDLFPAGMVADMFAAYLTMLDWASTSDWTTATPDLLPASQHKVRAAVNATAGPVPDHLLHQGFFEIAGTDPGRIALLWGTDGSMTYGELAEVALRLAAFLAGQRGKPVAVTVPKGPSQIVAVLGVLAAGAFYVPIGVDQPAARRERIQQLAGVEFVVTPDVITSSASVEPAEPVFADGPAYVIFTSGSTGDPKGVEITHRAAMNTIADINAKFDVGPNDRVLAVSALDFDLSVYDIFGLLSAGGAVVTIEEDDRREARHWLELVVRHKVTVWNTVPALLDMLLTVSEGLELRLVMVSGDWVGLDLPGRAGTGRFIAMGGATEASIWSNWTEVDQVDPAWRSIPYGFPLRNQRFRVVDAHGRDCPDWVAGELWIGGAGVAEGYRGAPDLTAAQFLGTGDDRWYRTGDLGRYWPDGTLEFLGRVDHQVKIRGHRIELGEIEAALKHCEGIGQAVVGVSNGSLVAGVVADTVPTESTAAGTEPDLTAREALRAAEAAVAANVLVRVLGLDVLADGMTAGFDELARDISEEHVPIVRLWLDWLVRQRVLTGEYTAGPKFATALKDEPSAADLGEYGALIDRAYRRLVDRVDDFKAILAGKLDAATILDDDVIAPAALAEHDPATEIALRQIADLITEPAQVAVLDDRTANRLRSMLQADVTVLRAPLSRVTSDLLHRFDFVVASNVFHRYTDPTHGPAVANLLVRSGGQVLAIEREELTPIALLTAGLLDRGYVGFDPERRRAGSPTLSGSKWAELMAGAGFTDIRYQPAGTFVVTMQARATATEVDPEALRKQVASRVPTHMVPERIEVLPWLPLSANGKVDRTALLASIETMPSSGAEAPHGPVEEQIAAMWAELLAIPSVGREQSFFEIGGDSLLATRFIEAAQRRFEVELPLRKLFAGPTVRALAGLIAEQAVDVEEGEL